MKKILLPALLGVLLISTQVVSASLYTDVDEQTWYYDSIKDLQSQGVMAGNPDGSFAPDKCVNRAEMLKILLESTSTNLTTNSAVNYTDISDSNQWYYDYVVTATELGFVEGYPDGTFKPEKCVNRAEALKMSLEVFNIESYTKDIGWAYSDVKVGEWYFDYFFTTWDKGLLPEKHVESTTLSSGWLSNKYFPADPMPRKEAAELISNLMNSIQSDIAFDSCGGKEKYENESWFSDFEAKVIGGSPSALKFTEGCLSLDGKVFIALADTIELGEGGKTVNTYFTASKELITDKDFHSINSFGQRIGNEVEVNVDFVGGEGVDYPIQVKYTALYDFKNGTVRTDASEYCTTPATVNDIGSITYPISSEFTYQTNSFEDILTAIRYCDDTRISRVLSNTKTDEGIIFRPHVGAISNEFNTALTENGFSCTDSTCSKLSNITLADFEILEEFFTEILMIEDCINCG